MIVAKLADNRWLVRLCKPARYTEGSSHEFNGYGETFDAAADDALNQSKGIADV
jgi:hypothetical protein